MRHSARSSSKLSSRISLNVIVYNEEPRLEECLVDARDYVDEIVVVDQMSTDATPEIAEKLADVFIRDKHHGHAEPSRERAASRSSGDWILILDADEKMSDRLKDELRDLVERDVDGYWVRKVNFIDGVEKSTIHHYRLVRKSRVRFDPGPHGGAVAVSDNIERLDWIGIVHEKTVDEQIYDDARYERMALEDDAPTSSKRNWLQHNLTLREQREQARRTDLESLVPGGAERVLIVGDASVELPDCTAVRVSEADLNGADRDDQFDAAIMALTGDDGVEVVRAVVALLRPGGTLVATAPVARNRRRLEALVAGVLSDDTPPDSVLARGQTRRTLLDGLPETGLDLRWMTLLRDGWLDPLPLRPDGAGTVVESDDFLLKNVSAEVVEELTAQEIVFAGVRSWETATPQCSIVLAVHDGQDPASFLEPLAENGPELDCEVVVVGSENGTSRGPVPGATTVDVPAHLGLAARWNAGARAARGELLVFATTDTRPQAHWLSAALDAYRSRPDTGAVGSKIVASDGTIEHAGLVLGPDRVPYRIYQGEKPGAAHVNRPRIVPAVTAQGMVTGRAQFVEVGGFDETFGDDLADADLCLRLRTRGRPILYAPTATLSSALRSVPGTAAGFRRSAGEFAARWSRAAFRSDEVACVADGRDVNWEWNRAWRLPRPAAPSVGLRAGLPAVAWTSHFLEQGGYTEEAIATVEALDDAGVHVVANPVTWDWTATPLPPQKADRLASLMDRDLPEDFVHVAHIGANRFKRHPAAMRSIGRTMFETDGLPPGWRDQCNAMDEVWVPSEHNLHTFAKAGVKASKLYKVPETFDTTLFRPDVAPMSVDGLDGFVFLSMFRWIGRKAWDVLLRAWYEEFRAKDDVTLLLKTDTDISPAGTDCRREVDAFVRHELRRDPKKGPRVIVLDGPLDSADVPRLFRAVDAFVLASHGEGWGRPHMEAMAMGLPTIATRWSGNLDFMDDDNSYLVGYELVDTPADSWLHGQRWAQPSVRDLRRAMRRLYEHPAEAAATGARARADVLVSCAPEVVAAAVRERIDAADQHPVHVSLKKKAAHGASDGPRVGKRPKKGRRITACVVAADDTPMLNQCLASLDSVADSTVVVDGEAHEDMASARNAALDRATGGWILMLDATQTLDPASIDAVLELVDTDPFVGYTARETHQFGLDGAVSAIERRTAALFPRHPDLRYVGRIGEQLLPRRSRLHFRLMPSRIVLRQHDHRRERRDPVATARQQLPLLERAAREAPDEPFHRYNLGAALVHLGLCEEAEAEMRQAIALAPRRAVWAAPAHASLSRAVAAQGRKPEAVKLCKTATKLAPDWAQGWCILGEALVDAGRTRAAIRAYLRALDCVAETWAPGADPDDVERRVRAGMGKIHFGLGEYEAAAGWLWRAVSMNPTDAELRIRLAEAYERAGAMAAGRDDLEVAVMVARAGPGAHAAFGDFFTRRAEEALLRGLADNTESRMLLERLERLRVARAMD